MWTKACNNLDEAQQTGRMYNLIESSYTSLQAHRSLLCRRYIVSSCAPGHLYTLNARLPESAQADETRPSRLTKQAWARLDFRLLLDGHLFRSAFLFCATISSIAKAPHQCGTGAAHSIDCKRSRQDVEA